MKSNYLTKLCSKLNIFSKRKKNNSFNNFTNTSTEDTFSNDVNLLYFPLLAASSNDNHDNCAYSDVPSSVHHCHDSSSSFSSSYDSGPSWDSSSYDSSSDWTSSDF